MKLATAVVMFLGIALASPALSQDSTPVDEIVVTGTKQQDPAMSAFLSGDFATAEIEFEKNAFCALRATRNFRSGVQDAADSTIRADVSTDANVAQQPTGGQGSAGGITAPSAPNVAPSANVNSSDFQRTKSDKKRTCQDRGYQVYMKGMSQLKLGKTAEAKSTLYKATKIHRTIYDAHFRLSLLEYQEGNIEKANKELKKLKKIADRCRRCEAKEEIRGQINYLSNLLN